MNKYIFLFGILFLFVMSAFGQRLSLAWINGPISNEQTINITGDTIGTISALVDCKNESQSIISVRVKKKEIDIIPGSENTFCWVNCYLPQVFVSPYVIDIDPDSTSHDFIGDYKAKGNIGVSTVMYTFFDDLNPNDSICVLINYDCSVSNINELNPADIVFSYAFPNPANTSTSMNYSLPSAARNDCKLIIRDMVGNIVITREIENPNGTLKIATNHLSDGVYFYSLMISDKAYFTRKLIVRH